MLTAHDTPPTDATEERDRIKRGDLDYILTHTISLDTLKDILGETAYDWAELGRHATSMRLTAIVSTAYTAISHEHDALAYVEEIRTALLNRDLYKALGQYKEAIMYFGFAMGEWDSTASDLAQEMELQRYTPSTTPDAQTTVEQLSLSAWDGAVLDMYVYLAMDALMQRGRILALTYRLAQEHRTCYEQVVQEVTNRRTSD